MRQGLMLAEAAVTCTAFAAVAMIALGVASERRDTRRGEERAAALETAQNLLARARRDAATPLPSGWTCEHRPLGGGVVEVRVHGPGLVLSTVATETKP